MPSKYKFAVWVMNEALVLQMKAAADAAGESITGYVSTAIEQRLSPPPPALHWSPAATGNCPRCSKVRAREMAQRRAKGILPHAQRRPSPADQLAKG